MGPLSYKNYETWAHYYTTIIRHGPIIIQQSPGTDLLSYNNLSETVPLSYYNHQKQFLYHTTIIRHGPIIMQQSSDMVPLPYNNHQEPSHYHTTIRNSHLFWSSPGRAFQYGVRGGHQGVVPSIKAWLKMFYVLRA